MARLKSPAAHEDKKQVPNQPPVSSGTIDYLGKRLSEADPEMGKIFEKIDR